MMEKISCVVNSWGWGVPELLKQCRQDKLHVLVISICAVSRGYVSNSSFRGGLCVGFFFMVIIFLSWSTLTILFTSLIRFCTGSPDNAESIVVMSDMLFAPVHNSRNTTVSGVGLKSFSVVVFLSITWFPS